MKTTTQTFFNLPARDANAGGEVDYFSPPPTYSVKTNWRTLQDQPITLSSILDLFANRIPVLREKSFLSAAECAKMLEIVETHKLLMYFENTPAAYALQNRWRDEAGINVLQRVASKLQEATGIKVMVANEENGKEYYAGILRAVDAGMHVHADFAPYEAAGWFISQSVAQLTWNILLNKVPGGDTLIYDRQWRAPEDDIAWRKEFPKDSYNPQMLEGHIFKAMKPVQGDLTFFNPRNFHEVKACDTSKDHPTPAVRFTVSSFVGYLPAQGGESEKLILWS
ncbi:hypothetical protein DM02DRAFT_684176 [Periconia macrospinosa]|uniref:Prolyl 4-hydroxylase alpha subunit Fe(2+) 2OG dioxygenase domain-containing protein n=1 Tax=Periconia macrospinosa TaxID=97972 RepID=A0A2V1E5L7_9PLEO|nr:hypothetical protein DM02DRAFT_684176 [Periconia macrospinosa]